MNAIRRQRASSGRHATKSRPRPTVRKSARGKSGKNRTALQRILKAARKVFSRYSFRAASTRMIAAEAAVDHPLIHYHFGSKQRLFEAMAAQLYDEFSEIQVSWLKGLDRLPPREALSLYLDRLLDYNLARPEALRIILLNMPHIGRVEEIPGYQYIVLNMNRVRKTLEASIPGSRGDLLRVMHCFHNLLISLIGAQSCQAQLLDLDPKGKKYRDWVKSTLMLLFLPALEKLFDAGTGAERFTRASSGRTARRERLSSAGAATNR